MYAVELGFESQGYYRNKATNIYNYLKHMIWVSFIKAMNRHIWVGVGVSAH